MQGILCVVGDVVVVSASCVCCRCEFQRDVKLGDVGTLLAEIRNHVHGMEPFQLNVLVELQKANQVVVFIRAEGNDFQSKLGMSGVSLDRRWMVWLVIGL